MLKFIGLGASAPASADAFVHKAPPPPVGPPPLHWSRVLAKWYMRLFLALMLYTAVSVLFLDTENWEKGFVPAPSTKEQAIARIGVMFDHAFQLPLWILVLLCCELGDLTILRCALGVTCFGMTVGGAWGLAAFYAPLCDEFHMCPVPELAIVATYVAPVMAGIPLLLMGLTLLDKAPSGSAPLI